MNRRALAALAAATFAVPGALAAVPAAAVDGVLVTAAPTATSQPWHLVAPDGLAAPTATLVDGDEPSAYDGYVLVDPVAGATSADRTTLQRTPAVDTTLADIPSPSVWTTQGDANGLTTTTTLQLTVSCTTDGGNVVHLRSGGDYVVGGQTLSGRFWQNYPSQGSSSYWSTDRTIEPDGTTSDTTTGAPGELVKDVSERLSEYAKICHGPVTEESVQFPATDTIGIDGLHFDRWFNYGIDQMAGQTQDVERLSGNDRIATSAAAAVRTWGGQQVSRVLLASSQSFADALAGSALAAELDIPLLLTDPRSLRSDTIKAIGQVLQSNGQIWIMGGPAAVSNNVWSQVQRLGYQNWNRISGRDRFATAVATAPDVNTEPSEVFLVDGTNYPDGLAAGVAAGLRHAPLLLTDHDRLPAATSAYLDQHAGIRVIAVGGPAARAAGTRAAAADRLVGGDRFETALLVAQRFFLYYSDNRDVAVLASGDNWPDALTGASVAGAYENPLLLTPHAALTDHLRSFLGQESQAVGYAFVLGGEAAVAPSVLDDIKTAINHF